MARLSVRLGVCWLLCARHRRKINPVATTGSRTFLCHGQTQIREAEASRSEICPVIPVSTSRPSATTSGLAFWRRHRALRAGTASTMKRIANAWPYTALARSRLLHQRYARSPGPCSQSQPHLRTAMTHPLCSTTITAASSLLRGSPPLSGASVLSASRLEPLVPFPLRRPGSHVPYQSLIELRAAYMPDAVRAVS